MNKNECKKYIKRASKSLEYQYKDINYENLEIEMRKEINKEVKLYVAYGKVAIETLKSSANKINSKDLALEVDTLSRLYTDSQIIQKSKILKD